jgi:hypothetical protein
MNREEIKYGGTHLRITEDDDLILAAAFPIFPEEERIAEYRQMDAWIHGN